MLMCLPGSDVPKAGWLDKIYFDKWAHAGVFFLLTFLFCLPFYNSSFKNSERIRYFMKIAIAVVLWGLTTEFIQKYFITGREFDLLDWAADSIGAFIAFLFCRKKFIKSS